MKLRVGNPLPGWQACLEAEALLPIGARLAARQGQALGGAPAQAAQQPGPASAFSKPAQAPAFGHASLAPKTLPGRHMPMSPKQGTGSLLHLPSIAAEGKRVSLDDVLCSRFAQCISHIGKAIIRAV